MTRAVRAFMLLAGLVALFFAAAFYFRWSIVQNVWPWGGGVYGYGNLSRLSYTFIASMLAAVALPVLWIGLTGEFAAVVGGALNLVVSFAGAGIYMLQSRGDNPANDRLLPTGVLCVGFAAVSAALLLWAWNKPFKTRQPTPRPVRIAFAVFAVTLIGVAAALFSQQPHIFPWPLRAEVSVVYGWFFLGAALYFLYGLVRPVWGNAAGQLLGFLAYDVVLILPFLNHFDVVQDDHRASLIAYTAVVSLSGLLAIYYLFVHPATRILRRSSPAGALQTA